MSDTPAPPALTPQDEANYANALLTNPLLEIVLLEMDHDAATSWRRSTSPAQREEMWHTVVAIAMFRKQLQSRVENLKIAAEKQLRHRRPTV